MRGRQTGLGLIFRPLSTEDYAAADRVGHFYWIDLLRGLAAVATLIWHYQQFYMVRAVAHAAPPPDLMMPRSVQPFYGLLQPIYEHGFWAVQAFWIISGFVFAHVYAGKSTRPGEFVLARFARLYPLHLITLVVVAVAQLASLRLTGGFQITTFNDLYHFFLQVFFVSGWGFQLGNSYNEPVWSVSVELAIYALFFVMARRVFMFGALIPLVFVGLGYAISNQGTPLWYFGMCTLFFYLGVAGFYALIRLRDRPAVLLTACAASLGLFAYNVASGKAATAPFPNIEGNLFVPIIVAAAMLDLDGRFHRAIKPVRWLGDATYSMYLWHVPFQVIILTACYVLKIGPGLFSHPIVWFAWLVGVIAWSHLSFRYIEKPLQGWTKRAVRQALALPVRA